MEAGFDDIKLFLMRGYAKLEPLTIAEMSSSSLPSRRISTSYAQWTKAGVTSLSPCVQRSFSGLYHPSLVSCVVCNNAAGGCKWYSVRQMKQTLKIAPRLLDVYFSVTLRDANDSLICALIPLLMTRNSTMFPDKNFSHEIRRRLLEFIFG